MGIRQPLMGMEQALRNKCSRRKTGKRVFSVSTRHRFDVVTTLYGRPYNVVTTLKQHRVLDGL